MKIEVGQIYKVKALSKHNCRSLYDWIKIAEYCKMAEERYNIKNVWAVYCRDSKGNWVIPSKNGTGWDAENPVDDLNLAPILFAGQIETHYKQFVKI